jgi:hypothetical protein
MLMDLSRAGDLIGEQETHPVQLVRVASMGALLSAIMGCWGAFNTDQVWEWGREAVRAVEIALLATGGGIMNEAEAERLWDEAGRSLDEHFTCLSRLEGQLDRSALPAYFWAAPLVKLLPEPD